VEADIHVFIFSGIEGGGRGMWFFWRRETPAGDWWENVKAETAWMTSVWMAG
jgi:hypothetical protein